MRLALECPTELLELVQPFADFDWILADRFLKDEVYAAHYRESSNAKFVDNSVTELGEPVSLDDLKAVFDAVGGTWVVSPDWIGEYGKTIEAYLECVKVFDKDVVVGVLQGATPLEALECLGVYQGKVVAVPYRVGGSVKGDPSWLMALRRLLVVAHIPSDRIVHLLGFTTTEELPWYVTRPNVRSIDTDVPVRSGLVCQDFDEFDRTTEVKDVSLNQENWAGICRNIALLRKYMS